jgi:hypothetical protein
MCPRVALRWPRSQSLNGSYIPPQMEQITAKEAAELEEETDRFSLQEYYTPTLRKRLSRFPHLTRISFGIVVASARRELIQIVALQALSAAGLAAELLLVKRLLGHLVGHSGIHFTGLPGSPGPPASS